MDSHRKELPRILRLAGPSIQRTVVLPRFPPDITALALEQGETVDDAEAVAFSLVCHAFSVVPSEMFHSFAEGVGVPKKQRSIPRAQAWLLSRWVKPRVRGQCLAFTTALHSTASDPKQAVALQKALRNLGMLTDPREIAQHATDMLKLGRAAKGTSPEYPHLLWLVLHFSEMDFRRGAADLIWHDPQLRASLTNAVIRLRDAHDLEWMKRILAGVYLLASGRQALSTEGLPEVELPSLHHQVAELTRENERLQQERNALQQQAESLSSDLLDAMEMYRVLLAAHVRADPKINRSSLPLDGLRVVIAGDPAHATGYREVCEAWGASDVLVLDPMAEAPERLAHALQSADVPVVVTAWISHSAYAAIEARVSRGDLVLVPNAGLASMQRMLLGAVDARSAS